MMNTTTVATVSVKLDRAALGRLQRLGFLHHADRDPTAIRDAVSAALADALAPRLDVEARHARA